MLHFSDEPYEFYPAKPNRLVIGLGRMLNRWRSLPGKRHRIRGMEVRGGEKLDLIRRDAGRRMLFLPNHSTHSDSQILAEAQRRTRVVSCYMAAYDLMRHRPVLGRCMQRSGCFSVDRDGSDSKSMKEAMGILRKGEYALTIFPEGNVYLMNDRPTPFLEGAAFIALKAQKELGQDEGIFVVPVSIKATQLEDRREKVRAMLDRLAKDMGTSLEREAAFLSEVKRIGMVALETNLRQRGLMPKEGTGGDVRSILERSAEAIIEILESKMELEAKGGSSLKERVRRIRARVHQIRSDVEQKAHHQVAVAWADEAMTALRILSYSGTYLDENPTLDRFAESAEKLLEDNYAEILPPVGPRHAFVQFNEPIDLRGRLEAFDARARTAVRELTADVEKAVQAGLDEINASNPHEGGKMW